MAIFKEIAAMHNEMTRWRHDLHAHPELAFQEHWTSNYIASKLDNFGIEVHRGLAKTGVVGVLRAGKGHRSVGLRADMDALPIAELNDLPYKSEIEGQMHACGHDGHSTMLLGAAKYLADTRNFDGTIHFIFQPAEENEGGARVMVEDGLFEKFPVDAVFGMHNKPGVPIGSFAIRPGPMLASSGMFEIVVKGVGTHAAHPHKGKDAVMIAGHIITAVQSLVRANVHPVDSAVVSITQMHGGETWNVIPEEVVLRGTARFFKEEVQDAVENAMRMMVEHIAAAYGAKVAFDYDRRYPPLINHKRETELAARIAAEIVGKDKVDRDPLPTLAAEDFSFMLQERPGAYINVGNGAGEGEFYLHNPRYNFNDEALRYGASYWVRLAQTFLSASR